MIRDQEKERVSKQFQKVTPEDFEECDIGMYECEITTVVWENKTDILITYIEDYVEHVCNKSVFAKYANRSNECLDWIEKNKKYIQQVISENSMFQWSSISEMDEGNPFDRLCLNRIEIEINDVSALLVCLYIDADSFFFSGHCHCIEVAVLAKEDRTYNVEVIKDTQRLLLEVRDLLKNKSAKACEWAENNGIFYALDNEGNMLAAARQQFCLSTDNKLNSDIDGNYMKEKGSSGNKSERSVLYFIWAKWNMAEWDTQEDSAISRRKGIPMPLGFVIKALVCEKEVFTITSSSGHKAVSGAFFVMQEALTVIEALYCFKGVSEEEINQCYYTYLVEDHQKYLRRISEGK